MGAWTALLDVLFPPACVACGALLELEPGFCATCSLENEPLSFNEGCIFCHEPVQEKKCCKRCLLSPPSFRQAFSAFSHSGAIARAVHLFKYEDKPQLAKPLGLLLFQQAHSFLETNPGDICPIPLHDRRFRQRRFDQSALLSAQIARMTGRFMEVQVLTRARETQRQVGKSVEAREQNLLNAFHASPKAHGRRFVLIDDVYTTGATAKAATQALLAAGAQEVSVLTLTRANLLTG